MPYKKNYKKGKKPYKRTNAIGRMARVGLTYASPGGTAWKALKLARRLADAVNTEFKLVDNFDSQAISSTGLMFSVLGTQPVQGLLDGNRIGDSIKMQNLTLRFYGQINGVQPSLIRVLVFEDKQTKIATPANLLAQVGTIHAVHSPKFFDTRFQTKVLLDTVIALNNDSPQPRREHVIPINYHAQFNNGTQTVNTGDLKILFISNINTGGSTPTLTWSTRLTFTDN